jgi:ATP-dependent Zn protease
MLCRHFFQMERLMNDRKRESAVHEAGHAVIARALGIPAGEVTIQPTVDSLGHSVFADPRFDWRRGDGSKAKAANTFVVALFAGAEAERILLKSQVVGDGVDQERATACLAWAGAVRGASFVGDEHFDRHEAKLRKKSVELVLKYRPQIELLADALMERETLTGEEVDALLSLE